MITPPRSSALVPSGTPIHTRSSTTGFLDALHLTRDQVFGVMSDEMAPFFLGPMPPQEFLSFFLPGSQPSSFQAGMFDALANFRTEVSVYKTFTLHIRDTSHSPDRAVTKYPFSISPDCTVYSQANKGVTETNSALSDIYIEFKNKAEEDAFLTGSNRLMNQSTKGVSTAGQITTYAALQLDSQYRTHVFSVLVVGDYARLIRWDRSGAIVTAPIYYQRDPELLDFFTRYDQAERPVRGHDDSVRKATSAEVQQAVCASEDFRVPLELLVVTVPLQGRESECREYIIKPPVARPHTPPGRATRTSIAYDVQRNCIVFFKDSWRVAADEISREGDLYAILNEAGVRNVPRCSASGDIGDDVYHSTYTNRFAAASWALVPTHDFTPHRHHRLILDDIGKPLETFKSSKDMVRAVLAALIAHGDAYWKCSILHRDISPNNILLTDCPDFGGGLLIDWDLCKIVDPDDPSSGGARRSTRTGTWQYMAADLIENPKINQTFVHDIESAFFVLLWMALLYVKSDWLTDRLSSFVSSIFDPLVFGNSGGSMKIMFMLSDRLDSLNFHRNTPLAQLLRTLRELLGVRYKKRPVKAPRIHALDVKDVIQQALHKDARDPASVPMPAATSELSNEETKFQEQLKDYEIRMSALKNHDVVIFAITSAIDDESTPWPADEPAEKQALVLSRVEQQRLRSSSKRCRNVAGVAGESLGYAAVERELIRVVDVLLMIPYYCTPYTAKSKVVKNASSDPQEGSPAHTIPVPTRQGRRTHSRVPAGVVNDVSLPQDSSGPAAPVPSRPSTSQGRHTRSRVPF
ncbi:hypothetical protein BJY52DRAFT_1229263 [Lactarius psammicola]|nr:hypothetical protein BJY52DRAFT_1229263 [Lactarius psammicola]